MFTWVTYMVECWVDAAHTAPVLKYSVQAGGVVHAQKCCW